MDPNTTPWCHHYGKWGVCILLVVKSNSPHSLLLLRKPNICLLSSLLSRCWIVEVRSQWLLGIHSVDLGLRPRRIADGSSILGGAKLSCMACKETKRKCTWESAKQCDRCISKGINCLPHVEAPACVPCRRVHQKCFGSPICDWCNKSNTLCLWPACTEESDDGSLSPLDGIFSFPLNLSHFSVNMMNLDAWRSKGRNRAIPKRRHLIMGAELNTLYPPVSEYNDPLDDELFHGFFSNASNYVPVLKKTCCLEFYDWYKRCAHIERNYSPVAISFIHAVISLEAKYRNNDESCM